MSSIRSFDDLDGVPHANVFPGEEPKTIRLRLPEGETIAPHSHPDRDIVFHLLEGRIELSLDDETHEVSAGDIARFEGDREISPHALESSTSLIVLADRPPE